MFDIKSQKGVSLYIAFLIMTILLSIALSMSTILVSEIKTMREMGKSVIAYYAAETGIEQELKQGHLPPFGPEQGSIGTASYSVSVVFPGSNGCPAEINYCIKSVGTYKGVKRAIMISR